MVIQFTKYQGTGNDFILIDHLTKPKNFKLNNDEVRRLCDRRFGIGADGFIYLNPSKEFDFEMEYYNSDGQISTMCGNGGRCAVAFAKHLGAIHDHTRFKAIDGPHTARVVDELIALGMKNVSTIQEKADFFLLDTGSPHYITFVDNVRQFDVVQQGQAIRNSDAFSQKGINVNFVEEISDNELFVRTYERGVEDETFSCGTGVTAASLVQMNRTKNNDIKIQTLGGHLRVRATKRNNTFENIELIGPAKLVFTGEFTSS